VSYPICLTSLRSPQTASFAKICKVALTRVPWNSATFWKYRTHWYSAYTASRCASLATVRLRLFWKPRLQNFSEHKICQWMSVEQCANITTHLPWSCTMHWDHEDSEVIIK
jgi:hypothetical protein